MIWNFKLSDDLHTYVRFFYSLLEIVLCETCLCKLFTQTSIFFWKGAKTLPGKYSIITDAKKMRK